MTDWVLVYNGYEPEQEGLREALCTLGNGSFATQGAAPDSAADEVHYPGTYLAGGYNRLTTEMAGRDIENEDLVNLPNWLPLTLRINDGEWLRLDAVQLLTVGQELDLKRGVLRRYLLSSDELALLFEELGYPFERDTMALRRAPTCCISILLFPTTSSESRCNCATADRYSRWK